MNFDFLFRCTAGVAALALLVIAGCGGDSGPARCEVSGTVSVNGQPLETGEIIFIPADGVGPSDACPITDGSFTGEVAPGSKRVEITGTKEVPATQPGGMPNYIPLVPPQYNTNSTLTAEVKEDSSEPLTFDLQSRRR